MKSSKSRTTAGTSQNYAILFSLLLVMGDLGIQTNNRVLAESIHRNEIPNSNESEESDESNESNETIKLVKSKDLKLSKQSKEPKESKETKEPKESKDPKEPKESEELINEADELLATKFVELTRSILEWYGLYNEHASTGMNTSEIENLLDKLMTIRDNFYQISQLTIEHQITLDPNYVELRHLQIENIAKINRLIAGKEQKERLASPYRPVKPVSMSLDKQSLVSTNWWKQMSQAKKTTLLATFAAIAALSATISGYFIHRKQQQTQTEDGNKVKNQNVTELSKNTDDKPKIAAMLVVLLISIAIGLSMVIYLAVIFSRNRAGVKATNKLFSNGGSKSNKSSVSSASSAISSNKDLKSEKTQSRTGAK